MTTSQNPYAKPNLASGYRSSYSVNSNNNGYNAGTSLPLANSQRTGQNLPSSHQQGQLQAMQARNLPPPAQQQSMPPPQPQDQQQQQQQAPSDGEPQQSQQEIIETLKRKLEEKDEENFELSASLSAVQVETDHRIKEVETSSRQQVSKLEEALRNARQEANMARAALKKQQEKLVKQQAQNGGVTVPAAPTPAPTPSFLERSKHSLLSHATKSNEPKSNSGSVSPSPGLKLPAGRKPGNTDDPMDLDSDMSQQKAMAAGTIGRNTSALAWQLLQTLPSDSSQDDNLRIFLTRMAQEQGHDSVRHDEEILWGLVQQCVDYSNAKAPSVLHTALLWRRDGCRSLVKAAGLENVETNDTDAMEEDDNVGETIPASSSGILGVGIRLGTEGSEAAKKHRHRQLEMIAYDLKQPLGLLYNNSRSTSPQQAFLSTSKLLTNALKPPTNRKQQQFSLKQQQLARQLVTRLSVRIQSPHSSSNQKANQHIISQTECFRIMVLLVSQIHNLSSVDALAPCMMGIASFLEDYHHHLVYNVPGSCMRRYDPIQSLVGDENGPARMDIKMTERDNRKGDASKKQTKEKAPIVELDPMLCELCRRVGSLVSAKCVYKNTEADRIRTTEFVNQWRRSLLANACDLLENRLLPFLLKLGSQSRDIMTPLWQEAAMSSWQDWIPLFTSMVQDEPGQLLLRTKFPLLVFPEKDDSTVPPKPGEHLSCSAMGVVIQLLHASVMVEQSPTAAAAIPQPILQLCQTTRDQSIRFFHAWLQCRGARKRGRVSFLSLVSEFPEYYKSACSWILYRSSTAKNESSYYGCQHHGGNTIHPDIVAMIRVQMEELVLDEEEALETRKMLYNK
jgi:PHP family Zn ribbon phosphoesterase